jgi:hypothetical protein
MRGGLFLVLGVCLLPSVSAQEQQLADRFFVRGDSNDDGDLNIADPILVLSFLFNSSGGEVFCPDALDANDDGSIDITDAIGLLGYSFLGGLPPRPPFPDCGLDPIEDSLFLCDTFVVCGTAPPTDRDPPELTGVISTSNTTVVVTFSEPMLGGMQSAENPAHYNIFDRNQAFLGVIEAVLSADLTSVALTTLSQSEVMYDINVANVKDLSGNQIRPRDSREFVPRFVGTGRVGQPPDSDGDGLSDAEEQRGWVVRVRAVDGTIEQRGVTSHPGDPTRRMDDPVNIAARDTDADGHPDIDERIAGTDPRDWDTDDDGLTDFAEWNQIRSRPTDQDSDGDGIGDGVEFDFFETSPLLADTDGDQFNDDVELFESNRNPRSADLPLHAISIGEVSIELVVAFTSTTVEGVTNTTMDSSSVTVEESSATEISTTDTTTTEWFAKAGVQAKASASYPGGFSASAEFTAEAGVGASGTFVQNESSVEASKQAFQDSQETTQAVHSGLETTRTVSGATLVVPLTLENVGDISFRLEDVELTALIPNPRRPTSFTPIGVLLAQEGTSTTYNLGTIDTQLGPFRFSTQPDPGGPSNVNADLVERLLQNPQGIIFEVSNFNLTDETGNSFAFQQQLITERTAPVVIDFEDGRIERFWAAVGTGRVIDTDGDRDVDSDDDKVIFDGNGRPVGLKLLQALEDVHGLRLIDVDQIGFDLPLSNEAGRLGSFAIETVQMSVDTDGDGIDDRVDHVRTLVRVRDMERDLRLRKAWVVLTDTGFDPFLPFDDVLLTRGEGATLVFITDADGDNVARRIELVYGSRDDDTDSDDDEVGDFDEIYVGYTVEVLNENQQPLIPREVFSSPAEADIDEDGLDDFAERNAGATELGKGPTDPNDPDTDGDGACDGPSVPGCPQDEFPLDPTRSGRPGELTRLLFCNAGTEDTSPDSGGGNDGMASGAGTCLFSALDRDNRGMAAFLFNRDPMGGGCSFEDIGHIDLPHLAISESFSIAVWVNRQSGAYGWIVGQVGPSPSALENGWARLFVGVDESTGPSNFGQSGKVSFFIPETIGAGNTANALLVTEMDTLPENTWAFYVVSVSYDSDTGDTTATLYRDNAIAGQVTKNIQYTNPSMTDIARIGSARTGSSFSEGGTELQGFIDDVRVFGGALSASNVNELFNLSDTCAP